MYTINAKATTKIVKQKVIANKFTKKKKVMKNIGLINKKAEEENNGTNKR